MKKLIRNLLFPTLLTSTFCVYAPITVGVPIISTEYINGHLEIQNYVYDIDFRQQRHKIFHLSGCTEDYDNNFDNIYGNPLFTPSGKKTKIVSTIPGYELTIDGRSIDSFTPVNLELAIHTQWEGPLTFPNVQNELRCKIDPTNAGMTFGNKPITLWRRNIIEPNNDPNDPNNYTISFMADIREAIAKQAGIIPLPDLNGTYQSQVPYAWLQARFDVFPGDLNLDGRVDLADFSYFANDWGKTDVNSIADITDSNGLPDNNVDMSDLELVSRNWLKDSNALLPPMPGEASNPVPVDGGTSVGVDTDLSWTPGSYATSHDVYFGTDFDDVNDANNSLPVGTSPYKGNQGETTFNPGIMALHTTYYWRIDEINSSGKITGTAWNFTTIIE